MNSDATVDRPIGLPKKIALLSILFSLVGAIALSNQSLWIDEAHSAVKAMQPSLAGWWTMMAHEKGSDLQMPFYMLYLWAWAKAFGTSEFALRAANLPWFTAGVLALIWAFPQNRRFQFSIVVVTLSNAFLWYYVDEARPYIFLFAFSALTAGCLFRLRQDPATSTESASWFRWFVLGIVGICATNMIAVPWALGAGAAFVFWTGPRVALHTMRRLALSSIISGCVLIGLCVYYLWSLQLGARASDVGRTGIAPLGFIFYELFGLAGLGPGRLALRAGGVQTLLTYAPTIGLGVIALFGLWAACVADLRKKAMRRDFVFFAIAVAAPCAIVLLAGLVVHMRLLGRHFTPVLPYLLVFLAVGVHRLLFARQLWLRAGAVIAVVAFLISALQIRFAPRHQRDDYRSAAAIAGSGVAAGETVWWIADEQAGLYYDLRPDSPNLTLRSNLTNGPLDGLPTPDLVCFSKPDIYDPHGRIDNYLREHGFKVTRVLPAFQIFERQPPRH